MKFIADFTSINLRVGAYKRVMLSVLRDANERAGQAWINTAVNSTPIPTWSGASRSTFQKLANELGTSVPIGPIRSRRSRESLGKSTSEGSGVTEDKNKGRVGFIYETDLRYLAYNEYNTAVAGPPPQPLTNHVRFTPYHFQSRAAIAWKAEAAKVKLPNPFNYLSGRKL